MPLSCKVIKKGSTTENGKVEINTEYINKRNKELGEKNAKEFIDSYEVLARTIVENARKQGEKLVSQAYEQVQQIQEEAYKVGYDDGLQQGYKESYEKGSIEAEEYYREIQQKIQLEVEEKNKNMENMLFGAKQEYLLYLKEKEEKIKELIIHILENVLKEEVKREDAITKMLLDAMDMAKKSKTVVIKSRAEYLKDIKEKIDIWKATNVFQGEVFLVPDDTLGQGAAVIQRENGKIRVDAIKSLDKVKEIIMQEE